jgi:hypothetical protein
LSSARGRSACGRRRFCDRSQKPGWQIGSPSLEDDPPVLTFHLSENLLDDGGCSAGRKKRLRRRDRIQVAGSACQQVLGADERRRSCERWPLRSSLSPRTTPSTIFAEVLSASIRTARRGERSSEGMAYLRIEGRAARLVNRVGQKNLVQCGLIIGARIGTIDPDNGCRIATHGSFEPDAPAVLVSQRCI